MAPKVLVFAGSLRTESFNKRLARVAATAVGEAGGEVTLVDLRDFELPVYDGDLEARDGLPANALRFKELMKSHHAFAIASPEYNSSISGMQKNLIDWCSREAPGEQALACFRGKVALLLAASPGALGGLRGLITVRAILGHLGVFVIPEQLAIPKAHEAFDANGALRDEKQRATLKRLAIQLVTVTTKLNA